MTGRKPCPVCGEDPKRCGCEEFYGPAWPSLPTEPTLDERLKSNRPGLPCCGEGGECTGGSRCWHDEPDNIPEGY